MNELPKSWRWATLDEVAEDINERVDVPAESGYDRFVGLEHFESGELTIKKWGSTQDVESSMKLFKKGDLLFARRNAYLRRASKVDFDGVCSGDAFVLRQRSGILVDNYLPLIFNTEALWDYAISNAAGSMSKRVKWRDLKEYEFPLPPMAEQELITEVLRVVENAIWKKEDAKTHAHKIRDMLFSKMVSDEKTNVKSLDEIAEFKNGINKSRKDFGFGTLFVNISDIYFDQLKPDSLGRVNVTKKEIKEYSLQLGDVVLVRSSVKLEGVGYPTLFYEADEPVVFTGFSIRVRPNKMIINPEYLLYYMRWSKFRQQIFINATVSANTNINQKALSKLSVIIPSLEKQMEIVNLLKKLSHTIVALDNDLVSAKHMKNNLINSLLSGQYIRRCDS